MRIKFLLVLAACFSASAQAAVVTLGADKDATIFQNAVSNSNGGGPGVFAGTNNMTSPRRGLFSFDLSSIPAGSTITDVQLTLTLGMTAGSAATLELHKLTSNWGEGTTGSTATTIGGTGGGFAANPGDATWNAEFYSATTPTLWTTPGGDFVSSSSASLTLAGATTGTAYTWLSTPQLVADAQGWLNNPATSFGWELKSANEAVVNTVYAFYSSEWHTFGGGDANQEPKLQITYTAPEPASGALAAIAMVVLLSTRSLRRGVCPAA